MAIQYKIIAVPALDSDRAEDELNRFLRSVRVVSVNRELIADHSQPFWSFVVEYMKENKPETSRAQVTGNKRVDYKDTLSPEDFALFVRLRDFRKETSEREAVPVYTIFTNAQLAEMAEKKVKTIAELRNIDGVGDARIDKYGQGVIEIMNNSIDRSAAKENES